MIHWIHTMVWGPGMLVLFLAVGILYTLRLRGFVFWGFPRWWKNTAGSLWKTPEKTGTNEENIQGGDAAGGMSPFQSACTALAATIGTREHSRGGHGPFIGRAGGHILDVGICLSGHGHGLW